MTLAAYVALGLLTGLALGLLGIADHALSRRSRTRQREMQRDVEAVAAAVDARFRKRYGRQSSSMAKYFPGLR
jgi:hypothetical protein